MITRLYLMLSLLLLGTVITTSSAETLSTEMLEPASIEASPWYVTAGSGELHNIYVTVLDKNGNPLPNVLVRASSDMLERALVEPESLLTNEEGKAVFTIRGLYFPGKAYITFEAGGVSDQVETFWIIM